MYYILAVYTVQALTQAFNSADLRVHEPAGIRVHVYHVHGADVLVHTHTHTDVHVHAADVCEHNADVRVHMYQRARARGPMCTCTARMCTCTARMCHQRVQVRPGSYSLQASRLKLGHPVTVS